MSVYEISPFTGCLCKAGLLPATGSKLGVGFANADTGTAGITYVVEGVPYYLANDAETSFSALGTIPAGYIAVILVEIVAGAAAPSFVLGDMLPISSETVQSLPLQIPAHTDGACPIGYCTIATATNPFICGTTAVDATGVTDTYYDMACGIRATPPMS